jgi:hypothetical protein
MYVFLIDRQIFTTHPHNPARPVITLDRTITASLVNVTCNGARYQPRAQRQIVNINELNRNPATIGVDRWDTVRHAPGAQREAYHAHTAHRVPMPHHAAISGVHPNPMAHTTRPQSQAQAHSIPTVHKYRGGYSYPTAPGHPHLGGTAPPSSYRSTYPLPRGA